MRLSDLRATAGKRFLHVNCGNRVVGGLFVARSLKLEARLVDDRLVDYRGFRELNALFGVGRVVRARRQRESADADDATVPGVVVTRDERVVRIDLVIDARTERRTAARDR